MKVSSFRSLMARELNGFNSYFGTNVGEMIDDYKVNYQIRSVPIANRSRFYYIDIDIYAMDDVKAEQITDDIELHFLHNTYKNNDSYAHFYHVDRNAVEDKNTYRRTLSFEVHTYDSEFE